MRFPRVLRAPLGYTAAALVFTWPLVLHPFRWLASIQGPGDAYLNLWILGWDLQSLVAHPASLITGDIFNASIFYPATDALAFSDHFLLQSLAVAPLYLVTRDPVFCYNALLVLSLIATAWAMHAMVLAVVESEPAAWVAGLAWGFAPYHFGHLIHIQLQALYFLPLAFLFLYRTFTARRARDAAWLGVMAAATAIASVYYGVIGGVALGVSAVVLLAAGTRDRWTRDARLLLLATMLGAVIVAPVAYRYLRVQQNEGFGRSLAEASQGSAGLRAYVTVPPDNLIYGRTGVLRPAAENSARKPTEQMLFPGFALTALAMFGLWRARRDPPTRRIAIALACVGVVGFVLSLGPDGIRPMYAAIHQWVFGFQAVRAPARFGVLVLFALAGLAAIAMRDVARARPRLALAVIALVAVEYVNAPLPYANAPALETRVGGWLRDAPERGVVMYQPLTIDAAVTTPFMVRSLIHGRRVLNGYSGQHPAFYDGLARAMTAFPSLETIRSLDDLDVKFIVTATPLDVGKLPLVERARFDDGVIYEVRWTAEAAAAQDDDGRHAFALPALGTLPFDVGETAVYSIAWTSGPLGIPAGHATFRVNPGEDGAKFQLSVEGTTAPWVSRFFQAQDRLTSSVDAALRPIVVEHRLREGSRSVDRRTTFDRPAGAVRLLQNKGVEISVPASPESLDPISAIYYLRAAIGSDAVLRLPINDWGREMSATVLPGVVETITAGGTTVQALRVEPHVSKRDNQPAAYTLRVWLSQDARRIPLLITVDGLAGVGSVRFELESFLAGRR